MEAEVAPKSMTLVFLVLSVFNAVVFLMAAVGPAWEILEHSISPRQWPGFVLAFPSVLALALGNLISIVLALLFARRLVKMREVRPEPNPRIWPTLGGSALLVLALQSIFWSTRPLLTWAQESMGYISYDQGGWVLEIAVMSKGLGPAFLLILAGLLIVVCFGMTRPRMAFLDEEHEVWGKPEPE
jgi:hypothetical protein